MGEYQAYIFLAIASLMFSVQFIFNKQYQQKAGGGLCASGIFMILHSLWVILIWGIADGFIINKPSLLQLVCSLICVGASALCTVCFLQAVKRTKVAVVSLFELIGGQLIPFVYSLIFTGGWQTTGWLSYLGLAVLIVTCIVGLPTGESKGTSRFDVAHRRIDWVPINKRSIGACIVLSLITFGIYSMYWEYLLVKNTRSIKKDNSSCVGEMLCLIFVPFYSLYWWFTRGKSVRDEFSKRGYSASSNETAFLVLALFGLGIVAMAIMQDDFNSLPFESTKSNQRSAFDFLTFLACMGTFLGNGLVSVATDMYAKTENPNDTAFLMFNAIFSIAVGVVFVHTNTKSFGKIVSGQIAAEQNGKENYKPIVPVILILIAVSGAYAALNGLGNVFSLKCAESNGMQASVQFPVLNSLIIIFTSLIGRVVFKEKFTKKIIISDALAVAGIILFMVDALT